MKRTPPSSRPDLSGCSLVALASMLFGGILLLLAGNAAAAGIVCKAAQSRSEQAVCADDTLRQLDGTLAEAYAQLRSILPKQAAKLQQAQGAWLKVRDQCAGERNCLSERYSERIGTLNEQRRAAVRMHPDQTDRRALRALRAAVDARLKSDPEFPLEKTLDSLRIRQGMTDFANIASGEEGDSQSRFPRRRPPGVSADEWRALRKSQIEGGGENGMASYTLVDLDGDGQRDLVIDSYVGGTGLFNEISVWRRQGDRFSGKHAGDTALYFTNGRGSNQKGDWIRLAGRIYVAYRNSVFGQDDLYLLRPFGQPGEVPTLSLHYDYDWSVPKAQKDDAQELFELDAPTHAALVETMARFARQDADVPRDEDAPLCPVPPGGDPASYAGYGAGHYSYEILGDIPVWIGQQCLLGQVVDWFGGYAAETGLFAQLWTRAPESGEQRSFELRARRRVSRMESQIGPRPDGLETQ